MAANPGVAVVPVSASIDSFFAGNQNVSADLRLFASPGVDLPVTDNTTDTFLILSREETNTYPSDVLLVDRRAFPLPTRRCLASARSPASQPSPPTRSEPGTSSTSTVTKSSCQSWRN